MVDFRKPQNGAKGHIFLNSIKVAEKLIHKPVEKLYLVLNGSDTVHVGIDYIQL